MRVTTYFIILHSKGKLFDTYLLRLSKTAIRVKSLGLSFFVQCRMQLLSFDRSSDIYLRICAKSKSIDCILDMPIILCVD